MLLIYNSFEYNWQQLWFRTQLTDNWKLIYCLRCQVLLKECLTFGFVIWKHPPIIFSSSCIRSEFMNGTMTGVKRYLTKLKHHLKVISIFIHYSILLNFCQSYSNGSWLWSLILHLHWLRQIDWYMVTNCQNGSTILD